MKTLIVNNKFNNKKLSAFLMYTFPNLTANAFYKALRKKDIRINDKKISTNVILHEGDNIQVYILDTVLLGENSKLDIIYEDANILVINKPKQIETVGSNSLTSIVQNTFNNTSIMPCHRLDRNTSGLILFAKNNESLEILINKFKNREITKFYKCKVLGIFNNKHEILHAFLFKDNKKSTVYISDKDDKGYRPIITEYNVLYENPSKNYSILEITLHTGRTHQIRAHLAHIGHPIIGDRQIWNK